MVNIIGWSITCIMFVLLIYFVNDAIQSYKAMKEAKRKAMIWDARIK